MVMDTTDTIENDFNNCKTEQEKTDLLDYIENYCFELRKSLENN